MYQEASQSYQATADVVTVKRTAKTWTVRVVGCPGSGLGNVSIGLMLHEAQDGIIVALASRYKAAPARLKDVIEAAIAGLLPQAWSKWVRTLGVEDATEVYQATLARINALMFVTPVIKVKETTEGKDEILHLGSVSYRVLTGMYGGRYILFPGTNGKMRKYYLNSKDSARVLYKLSSLI